MHCTPNLDNPPFFKPPTKLVITSEKKNSFASRVSYLQNILFASHSFFTISHFRMITVFENVMSAMQSRWTLNPLRPNNDVSQTSHCNIKGVSVSEVMRIENMITQVQFY